MHRGIITLRDCAYGESNSIVASKREVKIVRKSVQIVDIAHFPVICFDLYRWLDG